MLELFIGLSIDFILVKSWWFDKAKLIKHRRSTLMLAAWSLRKRKKKHLTNKKCSQGFSKLTLWRKKTKHSLITFPLHTKLNYFSHKLFWEKGKTHIAENKKKKVHPWYFHVPLLSHNLQILQHNHSIHKHKSKHWQCCVRDLTGCAQRAHQIALHQFNNFDNFNSYNC